MRSAIGFIVGLVLLIGIGLTQRSSLVYSLGVSPAGVAVALDSGDRACQAPVRSPHGSAFNQIGILLGTYGRPGPQMRVEVLDDRAEKRIATGRLPAGYSDLDEAKTEQLVRVGRIDASVPLRICIVNEGRRRVAVVGQHGIASPTTSAELNGKDLPNDFTINLRAEERPLLSLLPSIAQRASRFRAGAVGPMVYLLLAALVVAASWLLMRGISRAADADVTNRQQSEG